MRFSAVILLLLSALAAPAFAVDGSILKPPAGAPVALIVFEDLECPSCAQAAPLLEKAAETYKVPLVIHDVPLRIHPWANDAAVMARYLEQKYGRAVSDQFRDYIYQCQPQITPGNLRSYADRFCANHKIDLPFVLDPQGRIAAAIRVDLDLAQKVQLYETPTIFVVTASQWTQVADRAQLYATIDRMQRSAKPAPPVQPQKRIRSKERLG